MPAAYTSHSSQTPYLKSLTQHPLFYHMTEDQIRQVYSCFSFIHRTFAKDDYILLEGDPVPLVGIIIHGTVLMEKNDIYGNNYFFTELREHEIFAEPFMDSTIQQSSVNYKAMTSCSILFFHYRDIWRHCESNCPCHSVFTENLMNLLAMKSRSLLAKIEILSKKSLRDRILTFFNIVYHHNHIVGMRKNNPSPDLEPNQFFIPYNHTEMAEYLGVNRSALVRELKRMKDEQIIDYEKNVYTLK